MGFISAAAVPDKYDPAVRGHRCDPVPASNASVKQHVRRGVLKAVLQCPSQRPCAEALIIALVRQPLRRLRRHTQLKAECIEALGDPCEQRLRDLQHVLLTETAEDYCLVHTVEKLRPEGRAQLLHDAAAHRLTVGLRTAGEAELRAVFGYRFRADVRGHYDDRV